MNAYLYLILLTTTVGFALWRGGAPERIAAVAIVLAVAATAVVASQRVFGERETAVFAVDVALTAAVVVLAMLAERYWPIWMAAILTLALMLQSAIWYAPLSYRDVYLILHATSAYPTLLVLIIGTIRHRGRRARWGADPAWSRGRVP